MGPWSNYSYGNPVLKEEFGGGSRQQQRNDEMRTERKTVLLRLEPQLWRELNAWAEDELRSVNGQMEYVLHEAVSRRRMGKPQEGNR